VSLQKNPAPALDLAGSISCLSLNGVELRIDHQSSLVVLDKAPTPLLTAAESNTQSWKKKKWLAPGQSFSILH